jgi:hypothetical protein
MFFRLLFVLAADGSADLAADGSADLAADDLKI